ncbi:hypothetical protein VIGAN_08150200 [Vigna angularis var. angularis]|uniref:Uncharacterized protein n=1 Tax=Vigna angularis var. angularis TaxID=157739 RepID=A0A0S3SPW6_PHAAN|nr:hypothetical protein VIGAN_08150200 [Vigna angularis var. angularis]
MNTIPLEVRGYLLRKRNSLPIWRGLIVLNQIQLLHYPLSQAYIYKNNMAHIILLKYSVHKHNCFVSAYLEAAATALLL